jgi:hypothetical protein
MFILIAAVTYLLIRIVAPGLRELVARRKGEPAMNMLKIPAASAVEPPAVPSEPTADVAVPADVPAVILPATLCYECLYAHIVKGYNRSEELIACGYAFPMREVPFRVHECSDYKPKRERNRVEIANEGAVCILPLDEKAADFHAVAARRNGEGEVESSYE